MHRLERGVLLTCNAEIPVLRRRVKKIDLQSVSALANKERIYFVRGFYDFSQVFRSPAISSERDFDKIAQSLIDCESFAHRRSKFQFSGINYTDRRGEKEEEPRACFSSSDFFRRRRIIKAD